MRSSGSGGRRSGSSAGNAGLRVVDVSNPAAPAALGSLPALGGFATRVAYEAGRAYVSVQDVGMVIVDVSNPAAPVELGRYLVAGPSNFQIRSVAVAGNTAYIGKDDGIVRNRGKIESTIANARAVLDVRREHGSLDAFLWGITGPPRINRPRSLADVPAQTPESAALSKALKARGFRFVGPTTCYAFMQAVGMVDDHLRSCFRSASN